MQIPYIVETRPDTGLTNGKLGIWLFLASEVMLFGGLFSAYIILRTGSVDWPQGELNVWLGAVNTVILISSSVTMVMAWASLKLNDFGKHRLYLFLTFALSAFFLVNKYFEYAEHLTHGEGPWHSNFLAIYFTLTGLHGAAHPGRHGGDGVFPSAGRRIVEEEPGTVHQSHRVHGALLALRRPRVDLPVPRAVLAIGPAERNLGERDALRRS